MKKILFTFSLLLFTFYSYTQIVFNKIYGYDGARTARNVVIQNNNYYSLGGNEISNILGVVTSKFSLNGDFIESKYYADTMDWAHGIENSLTETGTGNYILGGNRGQGYFRDNLLIKFDSNFDTIFTKKYYPVDDNGYKDVLIWGSNIDVDGNYLLVGQSNIDNNYDSLAYYNMQLLKIDTFGNLLWRKVYGNSTYKYYGYKVTPAFDGGYILGGWSSKNGGDNCIIKTDENGENPIFKYFGHPSYYDGRVMGITPTKDSCYIISSTKEVTSSGLDKAHIYKLDKDLNIIWDKLYLNLETVTFFWNAFEKENGNLLVHGTEKNSQENQIAVILELTSEGDSIWKQTTTSYDTLTTDNFFENCKLLPDGGLIGAGWAAISGLGQQMWLLKTDSMGCDGTEWTCDVSYLEELAEKENGLLVYPNPVRENLHISLNNSKLNNNVQITNNNDEALTTGNVQLSTNVKDSEFPLGEEPVPSIGRVRGIYSTLSVEQFQELPIDQKLKYSSKNPNNTLWGEKEEQEMLELSRKLAYAFPFEVIKGKVDIFSIEPIFRMQIERNNTKLNTNSYLLEKRVREIDNSEQEITIYDIQGRLVKKETLDVRPHSLEINVSNLQKGIYFVQVGGNVAKFVKE